MQLSKNFVRVSLIYDLESSITHVGEVAFVVVDMRIDLFLDFHNRSAKITFCDAIFL